MYKITTSGRRIGISIDQEDGNMHKITTRRIGISIDQEDGNIYKITIDISIVSYFDIIVFFKDYDKCMSNTKRND
jgi:hypothetical protein